MDGKRRLEFPNDPIKTILFIHVTSHLGDKFFCFSVHGMFAELFFFSLALVNILLIHISICFIIATLLLLLFQLKNRSILLHC